MNNSRILTIEFNSNHLREQFIKWLREDELLEEFNFYRVEEHNEPYVDIVSDSEGNIKITESDI